MLVNIGIFKPQRQWGPKRLFLLICFDDHSNSVTTNGKPTMLLFSLPGGPQPPCPLGKYAYAGQEQQTDLSRIPCLNLDTQSYPTNNCTLEEIMSI